MRLLNPAGMAPAGHVVRAALIGGRWFTLCSCDSGSWAVLLSEALRIRHQPLPALSVEQSAARWQATA